MSKKNKYNFPKFLEDVDDPELIDWEEDTEDSDLPRDTDDEQRCFPFPALVISSELAASGCNPRYYGCYPGSCNPSYYCRPRYSHYNPTYCNPRYCNPRYCNPRPCNPDSCRPRPLTCYPASVSCPPAGTFGPSKCRPSAGPR
jgi:hypothetical protein